MKHRSIVRFKTHFDILNHVGSAPTGLLFSADVQFCKGRYTNTSLWLWLWS